MPHVFAFALAGAAVYTGIRLIAKGLEHAAAEAGRGKDDLERRAAGAVGPPKDLGNLEWDPVTEVYRPRGTGTA